MYQNQVCSFPSDQVKKIKGFEVKNKLMYIAYTLHSIIWHLFSPCSLPLHQQMSTPPTLYLNKCQSAQNIHSNTNAISNYKHTHKKEETNTKYVHIVSVVKLYTQVLTWQAK